ncbi:MAG: hypothetical protein EPO68_06575 [Planctomycetota bacterium]|nr:MAG: hypothetical protein EPO68_06575 [Planctomycetota bacterium]
MSARTILRTALGAALALGAFAGLGCPATHEAEPRDPDKLAALEHWRSLEPEQQGELERRYDSLRELSEAEHAELVAKKQRLDAELERAESELSADERARLEPLDPHARRAVLRELVFAQRRERGLLRRAQVPSHFVQELEGAPPHDRERRFHELRDKLRKEAPEQALRRLGERLGRDAAEIERALQADPPQRLETLRAWRREQLVRDFEQRGLPPFLERAEWDELCKLDDEAFWREFESRRPREPWCDPKSRGGREPREGRESRDSHGRGGPARRGGGQRAPDGARNAQHDGPPLCPTLDDLLELRALPQAERRDAIGERVRERALQWFEQRGTLDEARLAELRSLRGEAFFERLRELLRETRKPV